MPAPLSMPSTLQSGARISNGVSPIRNGVGKPYRIKAQSGTAGTYESSLQTGRVREL